MIFFSFLCLKQYQYAGTTEISNVLLMAKYSTDGYFASITGVVECPVTTLDIPKIIDINQRKFILRSISNKAFAHSNLNYVCLPEGIRSIHKQAFYASSLISIHIPTTLRRIHHGAFENCQNLTNIDLSKCRVVILASNIFRKCRKLTDVQLPFGVVEIGFQAFASTSVSDISFPSTLRTLQSCAFENCPNIIEVNFGNTILKRIHSSCFNKCKQLSTVVFSRNLTHIYKNAFNGTCIKMLSLPATLTTIGSQALASTQLTSIHVSNGNPKFIAEQGILYNIDKTELILFPACFHGQFSISSTVNEVTHHSAMYLIIKELIIPNSIKNIGDYAFYGGQFSTVILPNTLLEIGDCAFEHCNLLRTIDLKTTQIISVPHKCFCLCSNLTVITLPQDLKTIGYKSFYNTLISKIFIPASVHKIGYGFAAQCLKLNDIKVDPESKRFVVNNGALYTIDYLSIILVPHQLNVLSFRVNKMTRFVSPLCFAFTKIDTVKLGTHLECIGSCAFFMASTMNVDFPANLQMICSRAFMKCASLTAVNLQSTGLESIGSYAFCGCKSLVEVTLPTSLKAVGERAFKDCSMLRAVRYFGIRDLTGKNVFDGSKPIVYVTRRFPQVTLAGVRVRVSNS